MNANSLEVWEKIRPNLKESHRKILHVLGMVDRPLSCEEIANVLKTPQHKISGRFGGKGELLDKGLIREAPGRFTNAAGNRVSKFTLSQLTLRLYEKAK